MKLNLSASIPSIHENCLSRLGCWIYLCIQAKAHKSLIQSQLIYRNLAGNLHSDANEKKSKFLPCSALQKFRFITYSDHKGKKSPRRVEYTN